VGPTIRSARLVDYVEVARSVGLDPYKMLERVGLPRSCLRKPDLRISAALSPNYWKLQHQPPE